MSPVRALRSSSDTVGIIGVRTPTQSRLTTTSFDIEQAPAARGPFGYFLGEYEGLTNIGNAFVPVFVGVNNGNPANRTDVFSTTAG